MTANVGAETIYFAEHTKLQIDACELDSDVYNDLVSNTKQYKQVKTHNIDSMKMLDKFYDVILCDPPWGGDDYKQDISDQEFREYKQKAITDTNLKCPLKTVRLGLSDNYPSFVDSRNGNDRSDRSGRSGRSDRSDGCDISSIIEKCKCNFICLKLPLNEINSPYSNDYQKPLGLVNNIPIIQPKNKEKGWAAELKYVVVVINKTKLLVEKAFINRMPQYNLYMNNQIRTLDKQHLQLLQDYINNRTKKILNLRGDGKLTNDKLMEQLNYTKTDGEIFEHIRSYIKPPNTNLQYNSMTSDYDLRRAKTRAAMVKQLINNVVKPGATYCDIGSENGIMAKMIALEIDATELHMFEPFGTENTQISIDGVKTVFHKYDFQYNTNKYDVITILTTLHHIMNPEQIIKLVLKSIKPGGLLVVREHQPMNEQDKMFLDIQDKLWGYAFTQEYNYSIEHNEEDWQKLQQLDSTNLHYYPSSYFTKEQLVGIIGRQPDARMKGEGNSDKQFVQNGWPWYMYWVIR